MFKLKKHKMQTIEEKKEFPNKSKNRYTFYKVLATVHFLVYRFKIYLFKQLFTENEKCILNQALNTQRHEIYKEARCGLNCDYKQDIEDLNRLLKMCKNKLWD